MSNPIRVLHVLGRLDYGGAETMIMNLYRNIDRSKIQFDFVKHTSEKCDYDDEICKLGGRILIISKYNGKNHFTYKNEWRTLLKKNPEYKIIHGHIRSTASIYINIAKKYGLITIAHSHSIASRGSEIQKIIKSIMQFTIRYTADYLFACSDEAGKWLFGKKAIKKGNYQVMKNAIDAEKFIFNKSMRVQMRKSLNIEQKFVIGHVGSFTYPKNHKYLIEIFYEVQKHLKDSVLLLVGDGELEGKIQKQIEEFGLIDKVVLTGVVHNVNDYLQAMDMFVFPSIFEGLGIAIIEAQATGLPCIVANTVPQEAYVTSLVESVSLKASKDKWVDMILKVHSGSGRVDNYQCIKSAGYNIEETRKWLEGFYLDIYSCLIGGIDIEKENSDMV